VHPPLWESILDIRHRNPVQRLPEPVLAFVLKRLFQALDFPHTKCHVVHTDIKEANILLEADDSVLRAFEQEELDKPCPRKELDGRTIYLSHELGTPKSLVRQCSVTLDQLCDSMTGLSTRKISSPTSTDHQKPS
jgi:serine/threonine-protein kinase SRPK3